MNGKLLLFLIGGLMGTFSTASEPEPQFDLVTFDEELLIPEVDLDFELEQEKPSLSIKDLSFYCSLVWGYLYEEKIYPLYATVAAWFSYHLSKEDSKKE